ncbi:MAG TPA: GNAT family N-acetyltransferase [Ilumatobacteraceae bacterium]|jgi:ribosomal protein S18 acetylase RimI-like enzyme
MEESLVVRSATVDDLDALVAIQHSRPTREIVGLAGSPERARRFGRALMRSDGIVDAARPVVLIEGTTGPVAFMSYSVGPTESGSLSPRLVAGVLAALGPSVLRLPNRLAALRAVKLVAPENSFYIAELHVHPDHRGQGLGSHLLSWSSGRCVELGLDQRSLVTGTSNPAIHLYERHGFTVVATATDVKYQRIYGQAGRVLMTAPA